MNADVDARRPTRLLTVGDVLAAHEQLLAMQGEEADLLRIRSFVDSLVASGACFDEAAERKALQGILDYWSSELAAHATDQGNAGLRRPAIGEFDAGALAALQGDFDNPFGQLAQRVGALAPDQRKSPAAIIELVLDVARPQRLRFAEGLLKEIANQVAGEWEKDPAAQAAHDREDARLLEFCLWHLFEDPDTRIGNKLYRPKRSGDPAQRVDFFSCKVYLVRKAQQLCDALSAREQAALLDRLMRVNSRGSEASRPVSHLTVLVRMLSALPRAVQSRLHDTRGALRTFRLYGATGLDLEEFLQASRLVFGIGEAARVVHPALARWDPLKERRWKEVAKERRIFVSSTVVLVAVVTILAWLLWYWLWTDVAMDHLARSQIATDPPIRLDESVDGLRAANLSRSADRSYASQVANAAIGQIIGERARAGSGALGALEPYPRVPRLECEAAQGPGTGSVYSVQVVGGGARFSALAACPTFAVNFDGTRLAAAWQAAGAVTLRVFAIPPDFRIGSGAGGALIEADVTGAASWVSALRAQEQELAPPLHREPGALTENCKDRALRFSEDGATVSLECLYGTGEPTKPSAVKLIAASIGGAATVAGVQRVVSEDAGLGPCGASRSMSPPDTAHVTAVFLGPRTGADSGFVAVRGDGSVQVWHDASAPPCLSTQFHTDFVRVAVAGRPAAMDVQDRNVKRPLYALYAHTAAPVLRIYEQQQAEQATLLLEHYPPPGVGTPVGVRFTPQARCLKVRAIRNNRDRQLVFVDYYLVLDPARLLKVARALQRDLAGRSAVTEGPLPGYDTAVKAQCGAA